MAHHLRSDRNTRAVPPLIRLWLLRLLVPLGAQREFASEHSFRNDTLAEGLGLGDWVEPTSRVFDARAVRKDLRRLHQVAERESSRTEVPECLVKNVARLQTLVGLSDTDCRILEFAVSIHSERILDDTADLLGPLSSVKVNEILSVVLDIPEREIRAALGPDGVLAKSGLVSIDHSGSSLLRSKLDLLSAHFADAVSSSDAEPVTFLRGTVSPSAVGHLELSDYGHIGPSLAILRPYLQRSVASGRAGVNVFLYGAPGTGKSELARALARDAGCELFEVSSEDAEGDPVNGERRLRAFRAAQSFFSKRQAILLFDEAEDVFNDGDSFFGRRSTAQTRKAWINRTLEENQIPTLWLSNSIRGLDPAFVRRFDMVLELPVPPKSARERILRGACPDFLSPGGVARVASSAALSPAVVTRAASVIRSIGAELSEMTPAAAFEMLVDNTLEAQGHQRVGRDDPNRLPDVYDPSFINADADLAAVAAGLVGSRSGRLCLYGPPGTGKTAFGRWLAERMEVPLMVRKASDLMSMYVGGNERNIAEAFREAERENALLLIDEVDSFLQDRRGAQRGWEVSLVNEMLTQMESFPGVFVASTNLMEGLDPAALRRFDLKVKFGFLESGQACELLSRYSRDMNLPAPGPEETARLSALRVLTPGDYAAVVRQSRFRPVTSSAAFVAALERECAVKDGPKRPIGFHQ